MRYGDFLSTFVPGAVLTLAVIPKGYESIAAVSALVLIPVAFLVGGILEAITRLVWEPLVLLRWKRIEPTDSQALRDAGVLRVHERNVEKSYKWACFYANGGFSLLLICAAGLLQRSGLTALEAGSLVGTACVLLSASIKQWGYFATVHNRIHRASAADSS